MIGTVPLRAVSLLKRFGSSAVLKAVDISLAAGTVTALMGRSGSGKTTLLRALAFIDPPDGGTITFKGGEFRYPDPSPPPAGLWPDVTVVFQDLFLWPHLSCGRNILLPALRRSPDTGHERAHQVAADLGISQLLESFPNELSRGQRQLVALARAIAVSPDVLLLDEITASLDVETSARVASIIEKEKAAGTAIMLITHQFGFAREAADCFAYLHDGEIVEQGEATLLSEPKTQVLADFVRLARIAP